LAAHRGLTDPDAEERISALDLDTPGAIERVRAMLRKQPDSMDLLQQLAGLELESSNAAGALLAIAAARRLPNAGGEQKAAALHATSSLARLDAFGQRPGRQSN
jgi:hypothetical protein